RRRTRRPVIQPTTSSQNIRPLIHRIENNAALFRNSFVQANTDWAARGDNLQQQVNDFNRAVARLHEDYDARQPVNSDVQAVLSLGASVDDSLERNPVNQSSETYWRSLRTDLSQLAAIYRMPFLNNRASYPAPRPTTGQPPVTTGNYGTSRLTGTYRLDPARSDNPRDVADRATRNLPYNERQRIYDNLLARLESPDMLAIERRGMTVAIASTRAPQTTFEADGRERTESLPNGQVSRVSARLNGDQLIVRSAGYRETDFNVTFDSIENGRRLRVTREIWNDRLGQNPIVVQNIYDRTSDVANFNVYNGQGTYPSDTGRATSGDFIVPNGTTLVATLNTNLSTKDAQNGDRFTMTVREPAEYDGATIEGTVANVARSGRVTGRSEMSLNLNTIRLRNGQTYKFAGFIESARTMGGETVQVDNEGAVRDSDNRTKTTAQRAAIGTGVGAIIGAIAGGGKGAAIGAIIGAAGGAGSVYAQGRDDLELLTGSEVRIRASAPNR
ncbi:MAG: hypothetical protein LC754_02555, partial [Acidobacteria bacterium]|nr:hypothetical protein [Acidobacteriota bacterium]